MIRGLALILMLTGFAVSPATAQDVPQPAVEAAEPAERVVRRVVEPVRRLVPIKRVSAQHTPSGLPVPRYVSLKSGRTNGRTGPSRDHSIAWQYTQRGLPVIVVAETEQWRRVRDHRGDESWILSSLLSGERRAIALADLDLHRKPRTDARLRARVGEGAVLSLKECRDGWCEVEARLGDDRLRGWTLQSRLWGATPL